MAKLLMYDFTGSICCQMTRLVLAEKGVAYAKRPVDIRAEAKEQFVATVSHDFRSPLAIIQFSSL